MEQRRELFAPDDAAMAHDKRHVDRLQKPPLSLIRVHEPHVAGPEDDDDFIIDRDVQIPVGKENDNNSSNNAQPSHSTATTATLPAPIVVASIMQHHHSAPLPALSQPRPRLYPWLDEHSIKRVDQHSALLPTNEIRAEPTRQGYKSITVNHSGTDQHRSASGQHQSVHTRLLPPPPPAQAAQHPTRPSTDPGFWHAVTAPGVTTAAYGSSNNSSRRHSILRLGSSHRPHSERGMKKSASVEFKLHDGAHLKHDANEVKHYSGYTLGRDMPRYEIHAHTAYDSNRIHANRASMCTTIIMCRRLTEEEKEELYRIRPDLEIEPTPFFKEQMAELQRRNQKRVLFAMFGGLISIVLLLVFYALLARG